MNKDEQADNQTQSEDKYMLQSLKDVKSGDALDPIRRQLWVDVIIAGGSHRNPAHKADCIVIEYDKRFGKSP